MKSPPWVDFHSNGRQAFIGFDVWQAVARKKNQPVSTVCCSRLLNPQTSLARIRGTYGHYTRIVYRTLDFRLGKYYYFLLLYSPPPPIPFCRSFRDCARTTEIHYSAAVNVVVLRRTDWNNPNVFHDSPFSTI